MIRSLPVSLREAVTETEESPCRTSMSSLSSSGHESSLIFLSRVTTSLCKQYKCTCDDTEYNQ
jgi:hypothetical protein